MIVYFSGTGNSKYVAELVGKKLENKVLDMNERIKNKDYSPIEVNENLIFVVPTYAWNIPIIVKKFILKTEFIKVKNVWYIMTCGDSIGDANKNNKIISEKKNFKHKGTKKLLMPENYIALFKVPSIGKSREIIEDAKIIVDDICKDILDDKSFSNENGGFLKSLQSGMINKLYYKFIVNSKAFKVKDNCIGCRKCEILCPTNNIVMEDQKPRWGNDCTHCMACISYCPVEAIEYGVWTKGKTRYNIEKVVK
ncbi:MAG: EFR1 family ferrodoxin [Lagierella massiliensis]|nr:EFR1 family ferrodoxin [Lagierella massiliensis]